MKAEREFNFGGPLTGKEARTSVSVAGELYTLQEATDVVAGYAFAQDELKYKRLYPSFGDLPAATRPRWAYRTYEGIAPGEGSSVASVDMFVPAGLNADVDIKVIGALQTTLPLAFEALARIPLERSFWELPRGELLKPPPDTEAWSLHRAWFVLMSTPGVEITLTHKLLHHKRPRLVPLIDRKTQPRLLEIARQQHHANTWITIHDDLTRQARAFDRLEDWFIWFLKSRPGVPLSRLRMHDILLWCRVTGEFRDAQTRGADIHQEARESARTNLSLTGDILRTEFDSISCPANRSKSSPDI